MKRGRGRPREESDYQSIGELTCVDVSTPSLPNSFMLIDTQDWENLLKMGVGKISAHNKRHTKYAVVTLERKLKKIHRLIIPEAKCIDHINGNGLDNRRCNIRSVTHRQNCQNRHAKAGSRFPGVHCHVRDGKWRATIVVDGRTVNIGNFKSELKAAQAYYDYVISLGEQVLTERPA